MFIERKNEFECDQCHTLIPKSHPVALNQGHHFCSPYCYRDWEDAKEEERCRDETFEYVACAGYD